MMRRGYTLPELLLVFAFIAILVAFGLSYFRSSAASARDTKRKTDLKEIQVASEQYEKDNDCYPAPNLVMCASTSLNPYLNKIPCDRDLSRDYFYETEVTSCASWYKVYANLEDSNGPGLTPGIGPGGAYNYVVGSPNAPSSPVIVNTPTPSPVATASPTTPPLVVALSDSTYILQSLPSQNFGSQNPQVSGNVSNGGTRDLLLKFNISGLNGRQITSARLRLFRGDFGSTQIPLTLYRASTNSWTQNSVTWNNAPSAQGGSLGSVSGAGQTWFEYDVTSHVTQEGLFSFRLNTFNTTQIATFYRFQTQLVLEVQ